MDAVAWTAIGAIVGVVFKFLLDSKKLDADAVGKVTGDMGTAVTNFLAKLNDLEKQHLTCVEEKAGLKVEKALLQVQVDKLEERVKVLEARVTDAKPAGNY